MLESRSNNMQFAQHSLRVSNADTSRSFYVDVLGMTLLFTYVSDSGTHYFLGFVDVDTVDAATQQDLSCWQSRCHLELVCEPRGRTLDIEIQPEMTEGYWKIAISAPELYIARERLIEKGVDVD